jgi:aspartokinase
MSAKLKVMTFNLRVEAPAHDGINDLPNRKGRILETIATEALKDIPVRMISYGGSNNNISFLISSDDKKRALQSLSNHLFA